MKFNSSIFMFVFFPLSIIIFNLIKIISKKIKYSESDFEKIFYYKEKIWEKKYIINNLMQTIGIF